MKYIDTSAFVKYYSAEPAEKGAEQIEKLVDNAKIGEETLLSSVLLIGEAVSVFDKWLRLKRITNEGLDKATGKFITDVRELTESGNLMLEHVSVFNSLFSVDYIVKHHLTVNDALHLYAALLHKDKIDTFVCSDKNLLKAAEKEGFITMNPEEV
ncbi:MAG: type II toxin-antitoxin system VapC family toxin [Candidatus Aenigmatarchaeota archaeon]